MWIGKRALASLVMAVGVLTATSLAGAATIDPWTTSLGSPALSGNTGAGLTWGNGTASNADNSAVKTSFTPITLAQSGDSITLAGTVQMSGLTTSATAGYSQQFRWGLYNVNGQSGDNNWLGYFAGNAGAKQDTTADSGIIWERGTAVSGAFYSGTGATALKTSTASTLHLTDDTYNFSLTLTRNSADGLDYVASLTRTSDSTVFLNLSGTDTTPQTFVFNRIGLLSGGNLDADQMVLSNVTVVVPEPASIGLLATMGLLLVRRKRSH